MSSARVSKVIGFILGLLLSALGGLAFGGIIVLLLEYVTNGGMR